MSDLPVADVGAEEQNVVAARRAPRQQLSTMGVELGRPAFRMRQRHARAAADSETDLRWIRARSATRAIRAVSVRHRPPGLESD
jgi:hypothetical protein